MKTLNDLIIQEQLLGQIPDEIQYSEFTFEDFCKYNNLNLTLYTTENLWEIYRKNKYIPYQYINDYDDYDKWFFENELHVEKPNVIEACLKKMFSDFFEKCETINANKRNSDFYFIRLYGDINKLIELANNENFIEYMNVYNWSAYYKKSNNYISIKPNKTKDITNIIYNYDYIYHYCPKFIYDEKISKYGINPKHKFASKYEKVYCFYSKNPVKDMEQWARMKYRLTDNIYKKEKIERDNFVVLKIDLSKCKSKIKFWEDEESNSQYTFYTFEPIPPFAIIDVIDMNVKLPISK